MPLLVLFALAFTVGLVVGFVAWRYPRIARPSAAPTLDTARKVGEAVGKHPRLRAFRDARAVVPQRPLCDSCRLLCRCRASTRSVARSPSTGGARGSRGGDRRGSRV